MADTSEQKRLQEARENRVPWKKWGPYLSERQWGTVREDYSDSGNAWDYFSHDQARSRAYHWGEDGLAGLSDDKQRLCFALALWNGRDPILKERLFGLTNNEGNHGEDVKEYYFYLDSTPTHSYMKYLYKYPQRAYPYTDIAHHHRSRYEFEYELLDTGIFDDDRYFDVFVEYAKAAPEDILIRITVWNRGPEDAALHLLPTVWFRNTWTWWPVEQKPVLNALEARHGNSILMASHAELGQRFLYCEGDASLLFTENETNNARLFGMANASPYVKDGINEYIVHGLVGAVNPERKGTKASAEYLLAVPAAESFTVRLRLSEAAPEAMGDPFGKQFDKTFESRRREADQFYRSITPSSVDEDSAGIMRQALAGMLWSKQYYFWDGPKWLDEHGVSPVRPSARSVRNRDWFHMLNDNVVSMPDKWEYPWYAAWDLAFHTIALSVADLDFAKEQAGMVLRHLYLHPNGQVPAYEWNFGDVNPPVNAWAALFLYRLEEYSHGQGDIQFLKAVAGRLSENFTWWVNRKDRFGRNVFEGGFLGLDNIGVFDRSAPLPTGGYLEQADGTAWMTLFCQNMVEMAVELAAADPVYELMAAKFVDHFFWIAIAMNKVGDDGMWDEEDGFFYDVLRFPGGGGTRLKVRSMVGLLPLCAATVFEPWQRERVPRVMDLIALRLKHMPEVFSSLYPGGTGQRGYADRGILALLTGDRLRRVLARMLDEDEFLSPYGIRSMSRYHAGHPYVFWADGTSYRVAYLPGESDSGMFGGNSNWRGPIWFPMNALIIRALLQYYAYYGNDFKVECPTGSGNLMNLFEVSREIANRLENIFRRDDHGRRPVFGGTEKFQTDPYWRDHILFYEYFQGDNGAGLGASHQTGWTGLVARLIELYGHLDGASLLEKGRKAAFAEA